MLRIKKLRTLILGIIVLVLVLGLTSCGTRSTSMEEDDKYSSTIFLEDTDAVTDAVANKEEVETEEEKVKAEEKVEAEEKVKTEEKVEVEEKVEAEEKAETEEDWEGVSWRLEDWPDMPDTDGDALPDRVEKEIGTDPNNPDTDGDGLIDGYEFFITKTDPLKKDSNNNGINDGDEDFDGDGLTNYEEYIYKTNPFLKDTDEDDLSDGDEVNKYGTDPLVADTDCDGLNDYDEFVLGTDPLNPDTYNDGIKDGDRRFQQTTTYKARNDKSLVREVNVSFKGTGNINRNTTINNVMGIDVVSSKVVGLVGEPFNIDSSSTFDKAAITFRIDQSKLGDTEFSDLVFLWYDAEDIFYYIVETSYDYENSTVSLETTELGCFLLVDVNTWLDAWR